MSKEKVSVARPPRVAYFTTFYETKSGYSLITGATTQIEMMLAHGMVPRVLVSEGEYYEEKGGRPRHKPFEEQPRPSVWNQETVDLRPVLPALKLTARAGPDFEEQVSKVYNALVENLADIDVVIAHDIVLQDWYLPYNIALRRYAQTRDDLVWLHWLHSRPTPKAKETYPHACRYSTPPGYLIFPNERDLGTVYRTYVLEGEEWRAKVSRSAHALDILKLWPYDELTVDIVKRFDFLAGDVRIVFPARVDKEKQHDKLVRLAAGLLRAECEPRLLFVDWQSSGKRFQEHKDRLMAMAEHLELGNRVAFTSRLNNKASVGVPRQVVMELFSLSNVFANPSQAETYGFNTHEAILWNNLLVLNFDQLAGIELFHGCGIYMDFSSQEVPRVYKPTEQAFWDDQAKRLAAELANNRVVVARNKALHEWNPDALWPDFERLLYLPPAPGDPRKWVP